MLVYCWKVISCLRYSNTLESPNGQQCSLLGDPAYPMPTFIMKGYQAAAVANDEQTFSITMSTERQTVEWGFGDILSQMAFVDVRRQQTFSLQPVAVLIQGSCSSYELFLEEATERRGFSTGPLACRTSSQRNNRCADIWCLSKTKPYARACCRIRDWWDFQKENQHATSQVQFTVCLLLECLLFESYWIVFFTNRVCWPHGITENQATYLHCGGEARAKKRARPPATCRKVSTAKTGADTGPEGCGVPAVFPSPCLDLQRLQSWLFM